MNRRAQSPASSGSVISISFVWVALIAVMVVLTVFSTPLRAESAGSLYKHGQSAEAHEDYDAAFDYFQKALAKNPKDLSYKTSVFRVRVSASGMHLSKGRKLFQAGDSQAALTEFLHAAEIDPGNEAAQQEIARVRQKFGEVSPSSEAGMPESGKQSEIDAIGAPVELKPLSNEPLTLHMTEDSKVIYQAVGKAAGINVLFDPEYTSKRVQVDLNGVSLRDALRILSTISNTFWRPVTANTLFVAANTRAKHTDMDEQAVETFYLSNAWQQNDMNDVQQALRNVIGTTVKVYGVASQNAIVMRGTPDELQLAQILINDLDKPRPEVIVDIAIMEVSKNWERNLGMSWPSSVGMALQSPNASTTTSTTTSTSSSSSPTLYDLSHLKASEFAVTVGAATANLLLSDSNTKLLQNPRIRATDGQKGTMKIGSKIPIATGSYQSGAATAMVSSLVNTQFQYQDVGVNIEVTPTVHFDHDITIKMKIEVTSQSGSVTISGVTEPILSQRVAEQVIRLREGEASILGGIQEKQIQESWSGIPGLSSIPLLRYLFGSKDKKVDDDDIVFLIVPHVVRSQSVDSSNLRAIDTGVGTTIDLRHVPAESLPAPRPVVETPRNPLGSVPGQTAQSAAALALAQVHNAGEANSSAAAAAVSSPTATSPTPAATRQPPQGASLMLNAPQTAVAVGSTFQVPVVLMGGQDIASVPLQIAYDPNKFTLINVGNGDFLAQDGKPVALVHRDDGSGQITVNASRPPGSAGVNGAGVVCILSFQANVHGDSVLNIIRPAALNSAQQSIPVKGSAISIHVE